MVKKKRRMFNRIFGEKGFFMFVSSTIKQINFYSFGVFACLERCCESLWRGFSGWSSNGIFVFIISTEKPQAAKPKAIMKKKDYWHSVYMRLECLVLNKVREVVSTDQYLCRQKGSRGVNKINFQLIFSRWNHKVRVAKSTKCFPIPVPSRQMRAEANHSKVQRQIIKKSVE